MHVDEIYCLQYWICRLSGLGPIVNNYNAGDDRHDAACFRFHFFFRCASVVTDGDARFIDSDPSHSLSGQVSFAFLLQFGQMNITSVDRSNKFCMSWERRKQKEQIKKKS